MLIRPVVLLFVLALLLGAFSPLAYGLRLSQIEFDLSLGSGDQQTFTFQVNNNESEQTTVTVSLADWDRAPNGENRFFAPGVIERSASAWIVAAPNQFTLAPSESKEVRFTISVPAGVEGTYWTALLVEGTPHQLQPSQGTTILVRKRFAVKILETPPHTGMTGGQISGFEVRGLNPFTVALRFTNTGTVNLPQVRGRVELRDESGTLESIAIENFPVLPGAEQEVRVKSEKFKGRVFPAGQYLILGILDFGAPDLLGGQLLLTVEPLDLTPLGDAPGPPQDLDADGLFEDVNGDGVFNDADAIFLGFHLDDPAVQSNARAFDFDDDGDVDFEDVLTLKDLVPKPKPPSS